MPCIICKRDSKLTDRILIQDLSPATREIFKELYFCNWEYNFVCRRCYYRDFFRRARGNLFGIALNLGLRYGVVYVTCLLALSFVLKMKYAGAACFWGPVVFSALATLFFYQRFFRILEYTFVLVMIIVVGIYAIAYSDTMSLLPPMGAVVQRQRSKQARRIKRLERKKKKQPNADRAVAASPASTTAGKTDPVEREYEKASRKRQARVDRAIKLLDTYLPLELHLRLADLRKNVNLSLYGFALVYAVLLPWNLLVAPLIRWLRSRRQRT